MIKLWYTCCIYLAMRFCHCTLLLFLILAAACQKEIRNASEDEVNFTYGERNFGALAGALLKGDKFTSLVVEIQYMEGFEPDAAALKNLKQFLQDHLNKPRGIFFVQRMIPAISDSVLTSSMVDSIQKANRTGRTRNKQISIYILYTNGRAENEKVIGHAFHNSCIVIYGKTLRQHDQVFRFPTPTTIESTVLLHEFGHLLGLVNSGTPMHGSHADTVRTAHCVHPDCVMYWNMSLATGYGPLRPEGVPRFDSACLQDLKNNGGK